MITSELFYCCCQDISALCWHHAGITHVLSSTGVDADKFEWLDRPSQEVLGSAIKHLLYLSALEADGNTFKLTTFGELVVKLQASFHSCCHPLVPLCLLIWSYIIASLNACLTAHAVPLIELSAALVLLPAVQCSLWFTCYGTQHWLLRFCVCLSMRQLVPAGTSSAGYNAIITHCSILFGVCAQ